MTDLETQAQEEVRKRGDRIGTFILVVGLLMVTGGLVSAIGIAHTAWVLVGVIVMIVGFFGNWGELL